VQLAGRMAGGSDVGVLRIDDGAGMEWNGTGRGGKDIRLRCLPACFEMWREYVLWVMRYIIIIIIIYDIDASIDWYSAYLLQ